MSRRWGWFALVLMVAFALLLPLQLALGWLDLTRQGLSAREADGSVWAGRVRGASWHDQALGDLRIGLRPLPLLAGIRVLQVEAEGRSLRLLEGRRNGVEAAEGLFVASDLAALPGIEAELRFASFELVFGGGRCLRAGGRAQATLSGVGQASPLAVLSGSPQCAERAAVLPLQSEGGSARIEAELRIEADGRYRLQTVVRDADPVVSAALQQAGFVAGPAGLSRSQDGVIAWQ